LTERCSQPAIRIGYSRISTDGAFRHFSGGFIVA
jgi:hypothetical protein